MVFAAAGIAAWVHGARQYVHCRAFRKGSASLETRKAVLARHKTVLKMLSEPNSSRAEMQANFFVHMVLMCMQDVRVLKEVSHLVHRMFAQSIDNIERS